MVRLRSSFSCPPGSRQVSGCRPGPRCPCSCAQWSSQSAHGPRPRGSVTCAALVLLCGRGKVTSPAERYVRVLLRAVVDPAPGSCTPGVVRSSHVHITWVAGSLGQVYRPDFWFIHILQLRKHCPRKPCHMPAWYCQVESGLGWFWVPQAWAVSL